MKKKKKKIFLFEYQERTKKSSLHFCPRSSSCSTPSQKKRLLQWCQSPLQYFWNAFGNILHCQDHYFWLQACLSGDRGYLEIFSASLCLLFALEVPTCARKNILSMLYMERN